tara:strand:- start:560 stop:730 length:171 start_codon:yes stop_codon:yes gene_type:complete
MASLSAGRSAIVRSFLDKGKLAHNSIQVFQELVPEVIVEGNDNMSATVRIARPSEN